MLYFTITYRDKYGPKFAFIESLSVQDARKQVIEHSPNASILTVRETEKPLTITEQK